MLIKLQRQLTAFWVLATGYKLSVVVADVVAVVYVVVVPSHYARKRKTFNYLNYTT